MIRILYGGKELGYISWLLPPLYIAELVKQNGYFRSQKCGICTFVPYNTHLAPVAILTK